MADWLGGLLGGLGSVVGAGINAGVQSNINKENMEMQKEFAQNGIQWKVQDAKKAGIHPAVALGAQTYQASPSSVAPDVGSGVAGAFKHFGSAIDSFIEDKSEERKLQLEALKLDNQAKMLEIEKSKKGSNDSITSLNPASFIPVASVGGVDNNSSPGSSSSSGSIYGVDDKVLSDITIDKNMDGSFSTNYSKDRQDLYSESFSDRFAWFMRNNFSVDEKDIARDIENIRREVKVPKGYVVVPLPYRPGSGRRFKIVPKNVAVDFLKRVNSPWEQVKALLYMNNESF